MAMVVLLRLINYVQKNINYSSGFVFLYEVNLLFSVGKSDLVSSLGKLNNV